MTVNEPIDNELQKKLTRLEEYLADLGSLAVGFSGGVDSTFLLTVAAAVLGDKAMAVTSVDASIPVRELKEAEKFCSERGIKHVICKVDPLQEEGYRKNTADRCYFCKRMIFSEIKRVAKEHGIEYVAEGSNMDDLGDYRPGLQAIAELDVKSPLRYAELTKAEIREASKELGLPTWDKPSFACLSSRFVYGETITDEKLAMVDQAEQLLLDLGFHQVRVRIHGNMARIEVVPDEIGRLLAPGTRERISRTLKNLGFSYVTMDLEGYRTGSMNETL